MTADLQELTEIGRRRQARRLVAVCVFSVLVVLGSALVLVDPTTRVGADVLAIVLLSALVGLLIAYRLFFRVDGTELPFTGLARGQRRDLMKRLLKGGEIADDELQVADGLLTAANRPLLPWLFGFNAVLQLALAAGDDALLHLLAGASGLAALTSILVRRRQLARRTDVVTRAYRQRYDIT